SWISAVSVKPWRLISSAFLPSPLTRRCSTTSKKRAPSSITRGPHSAPPPRSPPRRLSSPAPLGRLAGPRPKAAPEPLGASVTGAVRANTDYVVAGTDPGSKATKAAALGVKLLDEPAWLALAGEASGD